MKTNGKQQSIRSIGRLLLSRIRNKIIKLTPQPVPCPRQSVAAAAAVHALRMHANPTAPAVKLT